ncbi:unnamed protein product, partial [Vitis vinifera]|uniref:Uncharacterized protein n=1 Tax=Vitis vinifera TaxID=29760 RepID=D7SZL1_VITVI
METVSFRIYGNPPH